MCLFVYLPVVLLLRRCLPLPELLGGLLILTCPFLLTISIPILSLKTGLSLGIEDLLCSATYGCLAQDYNGAIEVLRSDSLSLLNSTNEGPLVGDVIVRRSICENFGPFPAFHDLFAFPVFSRQPIPIETGRCREVSNTIDSLKDEQSRDHTVAVDNVHIYILP